MNPPRAFLALAWAGAVAACEPVPYTVDWSELLLLPPETAVRYLQSLPQGAPALALRPDMEHCEFRPNGVRVAAANPQEAQKLADGLRADARRVAAEKTGVEREQRRIDTAQRDRTRWMRANGFADLADEQARLDREQRDPVQWLRLRGLPVDQPERAAAGMQREKADLASRMRAVDEAMARERQTVRDRLRAIEERERRLETAINDALGRVHETVPYDRVAFVVYRRLRGPMEIDVKYAVRDTPAIDGCGFRLEPEHPETPATVRRIATALSALGAEGQAGIAAEPPVGSGRRLSARPEDFRQVTGAPPRDDTAAPSSPVN
jgi:hypothetical protein